jgi:DNA polymerase III gamma/tau subunit
MATGSIDDLKARAAAKKAARAGNTSHTVAVGGAEPEAPAVVPADAGLGEDEITSAASDELARLAAKNGETTSGAQVPDGMASGMSDPNLESVVSPGDETDATASSTDGIPGDIPGLTSATADGAATPPGNTYAQRQAELAAARAKAGGKRSKKTAAELRAEQREKEKAAKEKAKEKAAAAKAREKEKAQEKTQKQKDAEAARKTKAKEAQESKAKREAERKAEQAKKTAAVAAARTAAATPDLLKKMPRQVQELFARHYAEALEAHIRRPKCDRGDFCAGWLSLLLFFRKEGVSMPKPGSLAESGTHLPAGGAPDTDDADTDD